MADRFVRRGGVIRGRTGPRRSTQWLGSADRTSTTALGGNAVLMDQTFPFGEPATIVRTRGTLWVASDQVAATEDVFGAMGMAVVTDAAAAIGITAVPLPSSASDDDAWFVWLPWLTGIRVASAVGFQDRTFSRFDIDSKAMRKVHDGSTAVVVFENDVAQGIQFALQFRMLIKLHG